MKTSHTIAEQEERKAAAKDNRTADSSREKTPLVKPKLKQRDASRIAAWRWQPGKSANPGGRPKYDLAAELGKAISEENGPALYSI